MRRRRAISFTLAMMTAAAPGQGQDHAATSAETVVVIGRPGGPPCPEARRAKRDDWSRICAAAKLSRAATAAADRRDAAAARAMPDATPGDVRVGIGGLTASSQRIGRDLRSATSLARPVATPLPRAALPRRAAP